MDVELHLTSLEPPQGAARLGGNSEGRSFVGWLGLLHLLWELFGEDDHRSTVKQETQRKGELG